MTDDSQNYQGDELDVFAHATRWKTYWASQVAPYVHGGSVLEVGAGIGGTTTALRRAVGPHRRWLAIEPDVEFVQSLQERQRSGEFDSSVEFRSGTLEHVGDETFDSIVYIDVLEHIEADREELRIAAEHLNPGGTLIVLSPAYQFLFSEFDRQIGHFRRYDRASLTAIEPTTLTRERLFFLDAVGVATSAANKALLKQSTPSLAQVQTWDRFIVPVSRVVDRLTGYRFGRSVIGVWRRGGSPHELTS